MTRRSTPQAKLDERAFPVRLLVKVPPGGFGRRYMEAYEWLESRVGRSEYAWHGAGEVSGWDACACYFRRPDDAAAFIAAFPDFELADGTSECWYSSPHLPFGRPEEDVPVCNLYSQTRSVDAMRQLFAPIPLTSVAGNLEPGAIYPDCLAPIIRHAGDGSFEIARARWGLPSPASVLKTARDPGVTNVRNVASPHWRRWLGPAQRCLVPLTAFAEPRGAGKGNQWFAPANGQPAFFAGIEVRNWTSTRKIKDGPTTDHLFAFLTCPPCAEVRAVHPKAMPVILTEPSEWETWLTAPAEIALQLQRPLPDGSLMLLDAPI